MSPARANRIAATLVLAALASGATGCTHYHYYGNAVPMYAAPGEVTSVRGADVCEVPATGGMIVQQPARPAYIAGGSQSTVVVSEPQGTGRLARGGRFAWRKPDPESSLATTKVEGAVEDDTRVR